MHQSGWTYLIVLGFLAAIVLVVWLLGKLFPGKGRPAAGNALMRAEVFFNPSRQHVIEAREHEKKEEEESGDPPPNSGA
ncbi:MAG: hypothetical protein ACM3JB_17595 [Acidobacteriaceae bacterium]